MWLVCQLLAVATVAVPVAVKTHFPTADLVIANQVVAPPPAGDDATGRLQAAIDTVAEAGGGVVFATRGRYRLAGRLVVREGVTLRGDWAPTAVGQGPEATVLMPTADRGQPEAPAALTIERGSGLRELVIWYPDQRPGEPVPYPWTIRSSPTATGDNTTVLNVTLVNPWQGIQIGPEGNELHLLRNVQMTPLRVGLSLDSTTDIGRLMDVDLSAEIWARSGFEGAPTGGAAQASVARLLRAQAVGIDLGRSDWEYVYRVRVTGLHVGLLCRQGVRGTTNGVVLDSHFTDCTTALRLEKLNGIGLSVTGTTLQGEAQAIEGADSFTTVAQFNRCEITATDGPAVRLEGAATLTFQHCQLAGPAPLVQAAAGTVSLLDGTLHSPTPQVALGPAVRHARILPGQCAGPLQVDNRSRGDVLAAVTGDAPADLQVPHIVAPERHPAVRRLVVATDYGVRSTADDNTAGLQAALDAAAGGGTVYLPAGQYRLAGSVRVPAGVELRGSFDVPHHTISGGTVLLATGGAGDEDGRPLLELSTGSGVRGLTVWYPEQNLAAPRPYPWTIRALGPGCWLTDVTLGNAWQGVDFWSHPSDGHVIRYLAGCCLRRGLFVSRSDTTGWIENLQFNPHYALRLPPGLPRPTYEGDIGGQLIHTLRDQLEGVVIGRCRDEQLLGTFLYAAADGLAFRDDHGAATALVLQHGSDTVGRALVIDAAERVEGYHLQVVPLSHKEVAAFVTGPGFRGEATFINSQVWAGSRTAWFAGPGSVTLQQLNTLTGPIVVEQGRLAVSSALFSRSPATAVQVGPEAEVDLRVGLSAGAFPLLAAAGAQVRQWANTASVPPAQAVDNAADYTFATGWEPGQPAGPVDQIATRGGGLRTVLEPRCRPAEGLGRDGGTALRLTGTVGDPSYSFAYFTIHDAPVALAEDSRLVYWIAPQNERSRATFVDLRFADGRVLRDTGAATIEGTPARGAGGRGPLGEWQRVEVPLGAFAGTAIAEVMFAYDSRAGGGAIDALLDDLSITSALAGRPWPVAHELAGRTITFTPMGHAVVRYTVDGSNPTLDSPIAQGHLAVIPDGNHVEVRYCAAEGEWLSPIVYSLLPTDH